MTEAPPLLRTPLHDRHLALEARMVPFAGYEMPVQYRSILEEHGPCGPPPGSSTSRTWARSTSTGPRRSPTCATRSSPIPERSSRARRSTRCSATRMAGSSTTSSAIAPITATSWSATRRTTTSLSATSPGCWHGATSTQRSTIVRRAPRWWRRRVHAGRDPGDAHRRRPRWAGQLPRRAGHRGRHRLPRGTHRLHRRGRIRAVLRRPPRDPSLGCRARGGRPDLGLKPVRPRQPRHAPPRGGHAALWQRARPVDTTRTRRTWAAS